MDSEEAGAERRRAAVEKRYGRLSTEKLINYRESLGDVEENR